jgi:UPF0716 protein FxsA
MIRRLPTIICLIVLADLLILLLITYCFGWKITLIQNIASTILGIAVIIRYERHWSHLVAENMGVDDSKPLGRRSIEKMLLLVAGILLIIPGIFTDLLGLSLLMPWVRRKTATLMCVPD